MPPTAHGLRTGRNAVSVPGLVLNVVTVVLPPLRERKSDIPALVQHFVAKQSGWVVSRAAERLGISRRQLYRLMEKHGICKPTRTKLPRNN